MTTTTTDGRYRIVGDITVKGKTATNGIIRGKKVDISYGNKKTTNFENISIIQSRQPLTPESPYFIIEVTKCGKKMISFKNDFEYKKNKLYFRSKCSISSWYCTIRYRFTCRSI